MNREELLQKIKEENKREDPYGNYIEDRGLNIGVMVAAISSVVIFLLELIIYGSYNVGVVLVVNIIVSSMLIMRAIKIKSKLNVILAVLFGVVFIVLTVFYILALCYGMV